MVLISSIQLPSTLFCFELNSFPMLVDLKLGPFKRLLECLRNPEREQPDFAVEKIWRRAIKE